jgi:pimeloyl-ACP methyl ester carboxylesterase
MPAPSRLVPTVVGRHRRCVDAYAAAMPRLELDDVSLEYEVHGVGRPLLIFNGSGSTIEQVRPLVDVLATRCAVAIHDQRGMGASSVPEPPYSMADYAHDGLAMLDALGWDRAAVLGISFGGMVAQELAATWPDRIDRLVLWCTSPGGPDTSSYPLHDLASLPADEQVATGLRLLDSRFEQPGWFDDHPGDLELVGRLAERRATPMTAEQQRGAAAQLEARRHHDVRSRLDRITCPTLVGAGEFDGIAPSVNGRAIADSIPNATLRLYQGGHAFFAQDPRAVTDALDFLDPTT